MAVVALVLIGIWMAVVAGLRTLLHLRRTGSADVISLRRHPPGSAQWWAGLLAVAGLGAMVAAPVAELLGWPLLFDWTPLRVAGAVLVVAGIAVAFVAQLEMGESWRADVDPDTRTPLVTTGLYRFVRNPIFSATGVIWAGLVLLVPNVLSLVMLVAFVAAIEVQVRLAEEPYLRRVHGTSWTGYATRTGRFVPGLGREAPRRSNSRDTRDPGRRPRRSQVKGSW